MILRTWIRAVLAAAAVLSLPVSTLAQVRAAGGPALLPLRYSDDQCPHFRRETPACPAGLVTPPAGWYSGDTHEHMQLCFDTSDVPLDEFLEEMIFRRLNVTSPLIFGARLIDPSLIQGYISQYVTGTEDPTTLPYPDRIMQFGLETSGISAGNLGHMIGMNLGPVEANVFQLGLGCLPLHPAPGWKNDGSGDYSAPVLDRFRQAPAAVNGYAHTVWPTALYLDVGSGGFDWEDPTLPPYVGQDVVCSFGQDFAFPLPKTCGNTHPVLAPMDVALGRIDFIEAFDLIGNYCVQEQPGVDQRWFGIHYRLLNAGMRVSMSAGSDADCIHTRCEPRTYAYLGGDTLTYDSWTRALAEGRTSVATGPYQFLDIEIDGARPGDQLDLTGAPVTGTATVHVKATYHINVSSTNEVVDTIEIIQDGQVVASQPFGPLGNGSFTFETDIDVNRSGWFAARTASYSTHTSAIYTILDDLPVANCADAEYWMVYSDFLNWQLDLAVAAGPAFIEFFAGCSEAEMRGYIDRGYRIFKAIRDFDVLTPTGVTRFGTSSPPTCSQPMGMVTATTPVKGTPIEVRCFNAPPNATGFVLTSEWDDMAGTPMDGAVLFLVPDPRFNPIPVASNEGGYAEVVMPPLPTIAGLSLYMQFLWTNPSGCAQTGSNSSSDALRIVTQP